MQERKIHDHERNAFEEKVYQAYFISRVGPDQTLTGPNMVLDLATFCEKDEKGNYVRDDVAQAWWGWKAFLEQPNHIALLLTLRAIGCANDPDISPTDYKSIIVKDEHDTMVAQFCFDKLGNYQTVREIN